MKAEGLLLRDRIGAFAPGQELRAAVLLTYCFDGKWLEETLIPEIFNRPVTTALVIRDRNTVRSEAPTVRYHRAEAIYSRRVFHPKLVLLVAEDRALAVIGSANLTRGGLERNLELGTALELSAEEGDREFFKALSDYLGGPLMREVAGTALAALKDAATALSEVVRQAPKDGAKRHAFLHNYDTPLWEQILSEMPHRHVRRVTVVSPFYEPNMADCDDPQDTLGDEGIFSRLFGDLIFDSEEGEKPVTVCFQDAEGETKLPVDKLRQWEQKLVLKHRLKTSDDPRPLHAKLLVIEGARTEKHESYLLTVCGSANFTSAALLSTPPDGNAEIVVVTHLPTPRDGSGRVCSALGLDDLFGEVTNWEMFKHIPPAARPIPSPEEFRVTDAVFAVGSGMLTLSWTGAVADATVLRVSVEKDGAWLVVTETALGADGRLELAAPDMAGLEGGELLLLRTSRIRVEIVNAAGAVVSSTDAPLNVDCPQQFCGLAMAGPLMASLDQRIALAACGVPKTYREQQKFLEQFRARVPGKGTNISHLTHHADLDRFYRNLHTGCRGIRLRLEALPNSEFTLRRTLRELSNWISESLTDRTSVASDECRLFLCDRLIGELVSAVERADRSVVLRRRMAFILKESPVNETLQRAAQWVETQRTGDSRTYAGELSTRLRDFQGALRRAGGQ